MKNEKEVMKINVEILAEVIGYDAIHCKNAVEIDEALTAMDKVREQMQGRWDEDKNKYEQLVKITEELIRCNDGLIEQSDFLRQQLATARQEVERLKPYLRHFNGCDATHPFVLGKCTCGFDKEGQGE